MSSHGEVRARGPWPSGRARAQPTVLTVLARVAQALVLSFTFVMGLGWGGLTYVAALVQAGLAFGLIARLAAGKRGVVVLVPVVSAALTMGLAFVGQAYGRATACSEQERAAAQQLAPPPGTTVEVEGVHTEGCLARTRTSLPDELVLEHYRAEFARHGWQETPGRNEAVVGIAAVKDGVHVVVDVWPGDEGGAQMLEVVVGDGTDASPCLVNTVNPHLERRTVREVEPGSWMVLASTGDEPASVVIRDSTAAVVFRQKAFRHPDDADDTAIDERSGVPAALSLQEGDYSVECRPGDGTAVTVPLRVAWATGAGAEQPKDVVLSVFETPDHGK